FWRWLHRLPSPFNLADWKAGYVYELAFRQFEISETFVFDRPQLAGCGLKGLSAITSTWVGPIKSC
ncbi:MAG: hypothetical protein WCC08_17290, partial [Terrimicrobiaceae bacterium]